MSGDASMQGRTVFITGANTGIGAATAKALAGKGARVVFACRSEAKTRPVMDAIARETGNADLDFVELALDDLDSVKRCADAFLARGEPAHVLILNAGLVRVRGLTKQGFEMTFGVNHLGHFLLALKLRPAVEAGAPARVVVVASRAHERTSQPLDLEAVKRPTRSFTGWPEYKASKLANVLFTKELARRWPADKVRAYALHPGVIKSDIWRVMPWPLRPLFTSGMRTVEEGAVASIHCASSPEVAAHNGRYYGEHGEERRCNPLADDAAAAAALWDKSLEWVGPWL
jgi:NAD(P)-dependent dehydrogenase (short-subunit alcohol dehydrogenase family)